MIKREGPTIAEVSKSEASGDHSRRLGAYTTTRISRGRVAHAERHVARLRRDALRLGLAPPDPREVEKLLWSAAAEAFGAQRSPGRDGILRIEWSCESGKGPTLSAHPRPLGDDARRWRARAASVIHPGPEERRSTKAIAVPAYDRARQEVAGDSTIEEVLLFDRAGRLVEGSRANLIVVTESGRAVTPALSLGGVEGLGLQLIREGVPEIDEAEITEDAVQKARSLFAVNAVRGLVPITSLDNRLRSYDKDLHRRWSAVFGATFDASRDH